MPKKSKLMMIALSIGVALGYKKRKEEHKEPSWFRSVQNNEIKEVRKFMHKGQNVNLANRRGRSALMMATYNHHTPLIQLLIESGSDVNQQDDMKNSPYLYAAAEDYIDVLALMEGQIDETVTNRYGSTALILACESGSIDSVRWILEHTNTDVDAINQLGWTALLVAILFGDGSKKYIAIIAALVEAGANINISDKDGVTPLEHAEKLGYQEIEMLLEIQQKVM